jgi:hypothetical protein
MNNKPHIRFGRTETAIPQNQVFDLLGLDLYDVICLISTHTAMLYIHDEQAHLIERIKDLFFVQYVPVTPAHCSIIQILAEDPKSPITEAYILETLKKEFEIEVKVVETIQS